MALRVERFWGMRLFARSFCRQSLATSIHNAGDLWEEVGKFLLSGVKVPSLTKQIRLDMNQLLAATDNKPRH